MPPTLSPSAPVVTAPFRARGPVSAAVLHHLVDGDPTAHTALADAAVVASADIERDDDLQLALFALMLDAWLHGASSLRRGSDQ